MTYYPGDLVKYSCFGTCYVIITNAATLNVKNPKNKYLAIDSYGKLTKLILVGTNHCLVQGCSSQAT